MPEENQSKDKKTSWIMRRVRTDGCRRRGAANAANEQLVKERSLLQCVCVCVSHTDQYWIFSRLYSVGVCTHSQLQYNTQIIRTYCCSPSVCCRRKINKISDSILAIIVECARFGLQKWWKHNKRLWKQQTESGLLGPERKRGATKSSLTQPDQNPERKTSLSVH